MSVFDDGFKGFGLKNYRSFSSEEMTYIRLAEKINIITGRNNSGKSSLIDFACTVLQDFKNNGLDNSKYSELDAPLSVEQKEGKDLELSIGFALPSVTRCGIFERLNEKGIMALLEALDIFNAETNECWFSYSMSHHSLINSNHLQSNLLLDSRICQTFSRQAEDMAMEFFGSASVGEAGARSNFEKIINNIVPKSCVPTALKLDAIRDVEFASDHMALNSVQSGKGLANALNNLRNPSRKMYRQANERYQRLLAFLRDVMDDQNADILVPSDCSEISICTDGTDYLPINRLGTGIKELIIIAAVIACNEDKLICIEEPEIHLHAALQERLMRYLSDDVENQFILTTHSATIINSGLQVVTHVMKKSGVSYASQVSNSMDSLRILDDLGFKASDILQAPFIIWVEGPSDRIYVRHWIKKIDSRLIEGVHYSIVTYGGKLLSEFSAISVTEETDLISIFRINPHYCILMDSDREKYGARINSTKTRIKKECNSTNSLAWVTEGRTIENYIPEHILIEALNNLYPEKRFAHALSNKYICPLSFSFAGVKYGPDKIKVAKEVCKIDFELTGDLLSKVNKLCAKIKAANCMI